MRTKRAMSQAEQRPPAAAPRRRALLAAPLLLLAPAQARAQGPIRLPHAFGEAVLPGPARRVVSLGFTSQDALLALGTMPLAVRRWFGDQPGEIWPWARPHLRGPLPEVLAGDVPAEKIALLEPDLIVAIGAGLTPEQYALLSAIAPVLVQPRGEPAYGTAWDAMTRQIARALGREAEGEALIGQTRAAFAAARARHPAWAGCSAVAAYCNGGETGAFTRTDTRSRFLAELGLGRSPALERLERGGSFYAPLSPEDLAPLEADLLLWLTVRGTAAADLAALPMRPFLRAHREGREVLADPLASAALSFGSVLSLPFALAALEADLAAALDGDPATPVPSARRAGIAPG